MITEVARGSFGIVLEEAALSLPLADTQLTVVLDDVARTIDVVAKDDFEDFDLFMAEADTRYLSSPGEFFELLDDGGASDSSDVVSRKWRVKIRERIISRPNRLPKKTNVLLGLIEKMD